MLMQNKIQFFLSWICVAISIKDYCEFISLFHHYFQAYCFLLHYLVGLYCDQSAISMVIVYKDMFNPLNLFDMDTTMFCLYWRRKADHFQELHLIYYHFFSIHLCSCYTFQSWHQHSSILSRWIQPISAQLWYHGGISSND